MLEDGTAGAQRAVPAQEEQATIWHATIKKVEEDYEHMRFNTAIAALMELVNTTAKEGWSTDDKNNFLKLLNPLAPHFCEELWSRLKGEGFIADQKWPEFDPQLAQAKKITLVIQVNGKTRDKVEVDANISEDKAVELAKESAKVNKFVGGKEIKKAIYVPGRLVNLVV